MKSINTRLLTTDEILRSVDKWRYIIKTDLKSILLWITVSNDSSELLGKVTPFQGIRVCFRADIGLHNSSEYPEEVLLRILSDLLSGNYC